MTAGGTDGTPSADSRSETGGPWPNGDRDPDRPPSRRPVRQGREHLWRFLRTLVGLLLLAWLLAALFVPLDPFPFLLALVPLWVLSVPAAWYLVYRDGFERVRASAMYAPSVPLAQALAAFVVVAIVLKVLGTLMGLALLEARPGGIGGAVADVVETYTYAVDVVVSTVSLAVAYVAVFLRPFGQPPE